MTTVPPAEIADATTFASSLTVQGAFTSQGIDDNGNATALTIDSSENVLITKTATGIATVGSELKATGELLATVNNDACAFLNRKSSDGDIINLRKDSTTVGYVGTYGGDLTVGTGDTGVRFIDSLDTIVPISDSAGTSRDAAIDLGYSSIRYKDLYLSGGVYLGGTGSANKLDDFETGTFAPVLEGSVSNPSYGGGEDGRYTKVGNIVHFSAYVDANPWISNGSGEVYFAGLPFTVDGNNAGATRNISMSIWGPTLGSGYSIVGQPVANSDYLKFALWGDNRNQVVWTYATASFSSGNAIYIQGHYFTNS
jgi:hypothetical protein